MNSNHSVANDILLDNICRLLAVGKKVKLRVKGDSMYPFIHGNGDVVILAPPVAVRKGDIVLARIAPEEYVLHRVVRITGENILLAGDGNLFRSEECSLADVAGVAEKLIRRGKERCLTARRARFYAYVWRLLLPFRRAAWKLCSLFNKIISRI